MGVMLQVKGRKIAQVSINLTDCDEMPLKNIYDLVRTIAAADGVEILESELIGLMPGAALRGATPEELKIRNFSQHCLLETHLRNFRRR